MRHITIPNSDLTVSSLCLGTADMGTKIPWETARKMLDSFAEAGGNFFDTARVYAEWVPGGRHASEKTLGRWLSQSGNRDRVVLATKGAHPDLATMKIPRMSPEEITSDVDGSLSDLQTDRVDLWYLHRDDTTRSVEEILHTLWILVDAGKIRHIGCSNWALPRMKAAHAYAERTGRPGFVASQPLWNAAAIRPGAFAGMGMAALDEPAKAWHEKTQTAVIPYSSQANGLFQKLARSGASVESLPAGLRANYGLEDNVSRLERMQQLGEATGLSLTQITLGYLLGHPFPVSAIVGPGSQEQLLDTLSASDTLLTPAQAAFIEGRGSLA